jgi:hypothetical protein
VTPLYAMPESPTLARVTLVGQPTPVRMPDRLA